MINENKNGFTLDFDSAIWDYFENERGEICIKINFKNYT